MRWFTHIPRYMISGVHDPFCPNGSRLVPFGSNVWRLWKCACKALMAERARGWGGDETSPRFRVV